MSLNPLALLEKAINEHGSAVILKERLALAADQFKKLEEENNVLKIDKKRLEDEVAGLRRQLEVNSIPQDFVEARGVLFRRLANGNIEDSAYCPDCKRVMSSLGDMMPFTCSKCGFVAGFNGQKLQSVINTISNA